jgi:hypothetical protein
MSYTEISKNQNTIDKQQNSICYDCIICIPLTIKKDCKNNSYSPPFVCAALCGDCCNCICCCQNPCCKRLCCDKYVGDSNNPGPCFGPVSFMQALIFACGLFCTCTEYPNH